MSETPQEVTTFDLGSILSKYVTKPEPGTKPELVLVYSPPGSGKTWFSGSASELPGVRKVLYIDTEGSTVGTLDRFNPDKIDIIRVDLHPNPFAFANTILQKLFDPGAQHEYDVIVIDTFDTLQDLAIKSFDNSDGWELWRDVKDWSLDIAKKLKKLPALGIIVVHDREEKSESGAVVARLRLAGSAKDVLPGIPDMVTYLERKLDKEDNEVHTYGYFESSNKKVTKNRFGFPPLVKDVSLPVLWAFIDKKAAGTAADNGKEKGK